MRAERLLRWAAWLALLGLLCFGLAVAFSHPPMRLMPPPLLFQHDGAAFGLAADLPEDSRLEVFYATSRLPAGPRDNRLYTVVPDRKLHLGLAEMRIGAEGTTWNQLLEWSTGSGGSDRPFIYLERMDEHATVAPAEEPAPDAAAWLADIDAALARSPDADIIIYVHGANTTVERAAGQAAQLQHFSGRKAVVVLFAWPTAENFLGYPRDIESAFGGAPHLADLITLLASRTSASSIDVFTYSAGATIGSEALARLARERPVIADRLGEVYHAAPDADFRDFVADLELYAGHARRVSGAVNLNDSVLRLAQVINRASRAGRPDLAELSPEATAQLLAAADDGNLEVVQVQPDVIPDLSARSHTFWYDDPWVSNDVLVTLLFHLPPSDRQLLTGRTPGGARYWGFPADYPARIPALRDHLREMLRTARPADAG